MTVKPGRHPWESARRRRAFAATLATVAVGLGSTGCAAFSPVQTNLPYIQADGVPLVLDDVHFENLVVVAPAEGAGAVLTGQALNRTAVPLEVDVSFSGGQPATIALAPGVGDAISARPSNVDLGPSPEPPGAWVDLVVTTQRSGPTVVGVPVLPPDSALDYYGGIEP